MASRAQAMVGSRAEPESLQGLLSRLLGTVDSIEPVASGSGGRCLVVSVGGERFAAKLCDDSVPVVLGPAEQYALLRELEPLGIAAAPVACDVGTGLLVTRFVEDAAVVTSAALAQHDSLMRLARLFRTLHSLESDIPAFEPERFARDYVRRVGSVDTLAPADRRRYAELMRLADEPLPGRPVLCHNDLFADNILLGQSAKLLDFEYAVMAPPILDLASFVVMNDVDAAASSVLLAAYFNGAVPFSSEEFARVQRLIRLLAHFWSLAATAGEPRHWHDGIGVFEQYRIDDD
jgi:aminoglycoside phosphotransferase (APT) family kinase protein